MRYAWLLLVALFIASCSEDLPTTTKTSLNLNFTGLYDGQALTINQYFPFDDSAEVAIDHLRFFISDIRLTKSGGESVKIGEVGEIDFLKGVFSITFDEIEAATYTGISFGLGVDSVLNNTLPVDYANTHPLSQVAEYWDWRETYIFSKVEGRYKKQGNNTVTFVYHPGTDPLYQVFTKDYNFVIEAGTPKDLNFTVDTRRLFDYNGGDLDIAGNNMSHTGPDDAWLAELIMQNLKNAIEISE